MPHLPPPVANCGVQLDLKCLHCALACTTVIHHRPRCSSPRFLHTVYSINSSLTVRTTTSVRSTTTIQSTTILRFLTTTIQSTTVLTTMLSTVYTILL